MQRLCLDHNSGTPADPRVLARFVELEARGLGNPASGHTLGREARSVLEGARSEAAAALGVHDDEIVFVSGGTEANNLVIRGLGDTQLPVLLAQTEHPSVAEPALVRSIAEWDVDAEGRAVVRPPQVSVGLVTLVHAQSEIGALQPIEEAAALARSLGVPFHVDAAQTLGRLPLTQAVALADTIAFATHKAGGLRGQSVLVVKRAIRERLRPLLRGGGQELGLRPGTPNPALAAATALALSLAVRETPMRAAAMRAARDAFVARLGTSGVRLLTREPALPNTALFLLDVRDGRAILPALDLLGVEASQGSACSSGATLPPRLLRAMGIPEESARKALRVSFTFSSSVEAAERAADRVRAFLTRENRQATG